MAAKGQSQVRSNFFVMQPQPTYENNLVEDFELMKNVQNLIEENAHRCMVNNHGQLNPQSNGPEGQNHYLPNQITADDSFRLSNFMKNSEKPGSQNLFSQASGFEPIKHMSSGRLNQNQTKQDIQVNKNQSSILEGLFQLNHQVQNPPPPRKTNVFRLVNNNNNKYARIRNEIDQMLNQNSHQRYQSASPQQLQQKIFDERNQYVHDYLNDNLFAQVGQYKDQDKNQADYLGRILRFSQETQIYDEQHYNTPQRNPVVSLKKQGREFQGSTNNQDRTLFQPNSGDQPFSLFDVSSNKLFDFKDGNLPQVRLLDAQGLLQLQKEKQFQHNQQLQFHKKNPQALYLQITRVKQDAGQMQNFQLIGNQFQTKVNPEQYIMQGIELRRSSNNNESDANQVLGKELLSILKRKQLQQNQMLPLDESAEGYQRDQSVVLNEEQLQFLELDKSGNISHNQEIQLLRQSLKLEQKEESRQPQVSQQKSERIYNTQRPRKYVTSQPHTNHGQTLKKVAHNTFSSRDQKLMINPLKNSNNSTYNSRSKLKTLICNKDQQSQPDSNVTASNVTPQTTTTADALILIDANSGELNKKGTNKIIRQQKKANVHNLNQIESEEEKIERILKFQKQIKAKYNDISLTQNMKDEPYRYIIMRGNNSDLVRKCFEERSGDWQEISSKNTLFNFKWSPFSKGLRFDYLTGHGMKKMVNHFEFHDQLSEKDNLFINMQKLCEIQKRNVFSILPVTFSVDLSSKLASEEIERFQAYFNILQKQNPDSSKEDRLSQANKDISANHLFNSKVKSYTKYTLCENMFDGNNLWLLKPTDYNRGRGVQVFNSFEQFTKLVQELQQGVEVKFINQQTNKLDSKNPVKGGPDICQPSKMPLPPIQQGKTSTNEQILTNFSNLDSVPNMVKTNDIVIQKYLERPLLIKKRKFDIRLWVLVTHDHKCFLFKEGYIRTSSFEYDTSPESIDKPFIHLTNNAVQKYNQNYGAHEEGNQLSLQRGTAMLKEDGIDCDLLTLINGSILEIIKDSLKCVEGKLNSQNRKFCMEILGYDFIIDQNLNPWLIEVNTNPCLEESSTLLKLLIPRMVDDALKLTLDQVFPPKKTKATPNTKEISEKQQLSLIDKDSDEGGEVPLNLIIWSEPGQGSGLENQKAKTTIHSILRPENNAFQNQEYKKSSEISTLASTNKQSLPTEKPMSQVAPSIPQQQLQQISKYSVPGYSDTENMWNLIYQFKV